MNNCPIFISSADSYSDIWPVFFDLFKLHWPEYNGVIYLNTEEKKFQSEGLNIVCTQVGKLGHFGKVFRAGLNQIDSDIVLLMMIDYIFMGKVDNDRVKNYFNIFKTSHWDALYLMPGVNNKSSNFNDIMLCDPSILDNPSDFCLFSFQTSFWHKNVLYQIVLPYENPWCSEYYGSKRAKKMNLNIACLKENLKLPIPYDPKGCFDKGRWIANAVEYLQQINYFMDFGKRGYYREQPCSFRERLEVKWMYLKAGLRGSYWV